MSRTKSLEKLVKSCCEDSLKQKKVYNAPRRCRIGLLSCLQKDFTDLAVSLCYSIFLSWYFLKKMQNSHRMIIESYLRFRLS